MDHFLPVVDNSASQTPETDSFIAGIQAQGVEKFYDHLGRNDLIADRYKVKAKYFAAQLRKGVQS